ncbi:hypothetical protein PF008_g25809 [Phytophthora fragariae]|uniref:Uncharacterized protein n=1 Tax=Phytophthora fragariae TaxID=53985 RepID=A0A6G0QJ16_9STRA|nr:hypothetical protein PF008_g25809 [Phytophthora fragariae]
MDGGDLNETVGTAGSGVHRGEHASDRYDPAQQLDGDGDGLWQRCASALPQRALLLLHVTLQLLGSSKCRIERLFLTWEEEKIRCSKHKTSSLLGADEAWVGSHSGLARNVETALYVAPQLVPRRVMAESGHAVRLLADIRGWFGFHCR